MQQLTGGCDDEFGQLDSTLHGANEASFAPGEDFRCAAQRRQGALDVVRTFLACRELTIGV